MEYNEDDYLMISGIQHFLFCRRQWALIHIEQQWEENFFTTDGQILHSRADDSSAKEKRGDTIIIRSLPIKSRILGITGKCDVVELNRSPEGVYIPKYKDKYLITPIEYKRGKPKENESDILQLVAQAVCLEEMLMTNIKKGYLFYYETRRRLEILLTEDLRERLREITSEMHNYMFRGHTPKVKTGKKCRTCSLNGVCLPQLNKKSNVKSYIERRISECDNY